MLDFGAWAHELTGHSLGYVDQIGNDVVVLLDVYYIQSRSNPETK